MKQKPPPDFKIDSVSVAQFLRENPNFFRENQHLVRKLEEEPQSIKNVISLPEKRMKNLESEKKMLQDSLSELISIANENDKLAKMIHLTTIDLIKATDVGNLINTFINNLRTRFLVNQCQMRLINNKADQDTASDGSKNLAQFIDSLNGVTFTSSPFQISQSWFHDIELIKSFAYCPLVVDRPIGVLVLGSIEKSHYSDEKDTALLTRLTELLTCKIEQLDFYAKI